MEQWLLDNVQEAVKAITPEKNKDRKTEQIYYMHRISRTQIMKGTQIDPSNYC